MMPLPERRVGPRSCNDGEPRHPFGRVVVVTRQGNYSAFSGYHFTPSDYSACRCLECGTYWRTKAAYVWDLPDAAPDQRW